MSTLVTTCLGVLFLGLAVLATALMYQFWGYPYDEEKRVSSCPQWKMNIHRAVGFAYLIVYVLLMIEMAPRMWHYQVEFPARTVAHLILGITIGVLLLIKIAILRFWRHFEEWMPVLGTGILLCSFLLAGLSLPFAFKERALFAAAPGGSALSPQSQQRVAKLLPTAGMPESTDLKILASAESLSAGRDVLLADCVLCHDLKTIISRPRTPADWYHTVSRMVEKPTLGDPIDETEANQVTAFLVAITPDLQRSVKAKRATDQRAQSMREAAHRDDGGGEGQDAGAAEPAPSFPPDEASAVFEEVCALCHETSEVEENPPKTGDDVEKLIERMIGNGLLAEPADLEKVKWHLRETYVEE